MNKKYAYIWVSLIILIFGIIVIPRIVDRIKSGTVVENDRMNVAPTTKELSYITLNGKRRRVPAFELLNQDSVLISDKD